LPIEVRELPAGFLPVSSGLYDIYATSGGLTPSTPKTRINGISLQKLLEGDFMEEYDRDRLGISLATSMIDLHHLWPCEWGKRDVFFCKSNMDYSTRINRLDAFSAINLKRPLIRPKFEPPLNTNSLADSLNQSFRAIEQNQKHLISLGIIITGLALGKQIEELYPNEPWVRDFGKLTAENIDDLLEKIRENLALVSQERAIGACLGFFRGTEKSPSRDDIVAIVRNQVLPELVGESEFPVKNPVIDGRSLGLSSHAKYKLLDINGQHCDSYGNSLDPLQPPSLPSSETLYRILRRRRGYPKSWTSDFILQLV
jgi:hypothetical protein